MAGGTRCDWGVLVLVRLRVYGLVLFGLEGWGASGGDILGQMKRAWLCEVLGVVGIEKPPWGWAAWFVLGLERLD